MGDTIFAGKLNVGTNVISTTSTQANVIGTDGDTIKISVARTPSGPTASGLTGEICWDSSYFYICIANNSWKRVAHGSTLWL
jgi:hypothetical protein